MTSLTLIKKQPQERTQTQKTFHRLQKKVRELQKKTEKRTRELNEALQFYFGQIRPKEDSYAKVLMERAQLTYTFYKNRKGFSKKERAILKKLLIEDVDRVFAMLEPSDLSDEFKQIYKDLKGHDFEDLALEKLEEMCEEFDVDFDLSGIDPTDTRQETIDKLFESFDKAMKDKSEHRTEPKKKEKELKREELQERSLNTIYKQLAKTFHPDLEPDIEKKKLKEGFMKQLTVAYGKNDLHALLSLELQWMNTSGSVAQAHTDKQLNIYNQILEDQVKALQRDIHFIWDSPKYFPLQRFYRGSFDGLMTLQHVELMLEASSTHLSRFLELLRGPEAESTIKQAIMEEGES